jgi:hypothetical protein
MYPQVLKALQRIAASLGKYTGQRVETDVIRQTGFLLTNLDYQLYQESYLYQSDQYLW